MGGIGEKRALPLVAREAAEWNYTRMDQEEYKHKRQVLDAALQGHRPRPCVASATR